MDEKRADTIEPVARDPSSDARERRLRTALSVSNVGLFEIDRATRTLEIDARGCALLALPEGPVDLERLFAGVHRDDRERLEVGLRALLEAPPGEIWHEEARVQETLVRIDAHAFGEGKDATHVVGTVGARSSRLERELEHRVGELSRTIRQSETSIGVLGHGLRNPLAAIVTAAQLALRREDSGPIRPLLSRIVRSAERIARMSAHLLDFTWARLGDGIPLQLERFDLGTVAREAVDECRAARPDRGVELLVEGDSVGTWDRVHVSQTLVTLIANAVHHGTPDAPVTVRVDGRDAAAIEVSVHNGGVVPEAVVPLLFEPFRATMVALDERRTVGLGLFLAREIVRGHGGAVTVESAPERGTTFRVRLPRTVTDARARYLADDPREELRKLDRLAAPPSDTAVTARMFGAVPLPNRAPHAYWPLYERYAELIDFLVAQRAYHAADGHMPHVSAQLRAIAERLGELDAGPRDVADLHARAIRKKTSGVPHPRAQAIIADGRLIAFELMGHLAAYYRRRRHGGAR